jgi:CBS domain-containing protein
MEEAMFGYLTVLEAKRMGVMACRRDCKLSEAAHRMLEEDVSSLVVTDNEGCLAGIITRTDLLRAANSSAAWWDELTETYMNTQVVTVPPTAHLSEVAAILIEHQIHRVVVVRAEDGKIKPLSVVSAADLLYHMVKEIES